MSSTMKMLGLVGLGLQQTVAGAGLSVDSSVMCLNWASTPQTVTTSPPLVKPADVVVDGSGDIFVVDSVRAEVIRIDGTSHESQVVLGPPVLEVPIGIAISPTHGDLYIGDGNTSTIWYLPCTTRNSNTCPVYYGSASNISLSHSVHPMGLELDGADNLYIADYAGHRVLKRNVYTGQTEPILSATNLPKKDSEFSPVDVTVDPTTHEVLATDNVNDDIWALKCDVVDKSGNFCDQYDATPLELALEGSASNIESPAGIATDLQETIFVTGQKDGIVAEIKGNASVDLLQEGTPGYLKEPVALAFDQRPISKALIITDDPTGNTDTTQGLYILSCTKLVCVPLDSRYVSHVDGSACTNVGIDQSCSLKCADGYSSNVSSITCTSEGWDNLGVYCTETGSTSFTTVSSEVAAADAGVAVAIMLVMLVILAALVFLLIRMRTVAKQFSTETSPYSPFGSVGQ